MPHGNETPQVRDNRPPLIHGGKTLEWSRTHHADQGAINLAQLPIWCLSRIELIMAAFVQQLPGGPFNLRVEVHDITLTRSQGRGIALSFHTPRDGSEELTAHIRFALPQGHRPIDVPVIECRLHGVPLSTINKLNEHRRKLLGTIPSDFTRRNPALFIAPPAVIACPTPERPSCAPPHAAQQPQETAALQLSVARVVSAAWSLYGTEAIDIEKLAATLEGAPEPMPAATATIALMVRWKWLVQNGVGYYLSETAQRFCFEKDELIVLPTT